MINTLTHFHEGEVVVYPAGEICPRCREELSPDELLRAHFDAIEAGE